MDRPPTTPPPAEPAPGQSVTIADYDADGYDYRHYWRGREYEDWAEARVIRRCLRPVGVVPWLVDLGGGFGRNLPQYRPFARRLVLVDYSMTNLSAAERQLAREPRLDGDVALVRANLYHLPFRDGVFDTGATVRVLHHLQELDRALAEMSRVIGAHWLVDVPSKHHLRARLHAWRQGQWRYAPGPEPQEIGTADVPYYNYSVPAVRHALAALGWQGGVAASVANLRGWERAFPGPLRRLARPAVYGVERIAQPLGRTWWGPSQWLWLARASGAPAPVAPETAAAAGERAGVAVRSLMQCPRCGGALRWEDAAAHCDACATAFPRQGQVWDFVVR